MGGGVAQGASTVYDATKNAIINGKKYIKESSVKITPNPTQVAKVLARGAAGYALSVAVEQLLGSVDWVLDPANNQIRYFPAGEDPGIVDDKDYSHWMLNFSWYATVDLAKSALESKNNWTCRTGSPRYQIICLNSKGAEVFRDTLASRSKEIEIEKPEEKTLPLTTVAAQVISNAESETDSQKKAAAQAATTAAAADIVAEAEKDDAKARPIASQAEANATTKPADAAEAEKANEAQGEAKPNEANPEATDLSIKFPIFCNWAPTICEAAQVVISFPNTLTGWWDTTNQKADSWASSIAEAWASVKEWATGEPDLQEDQTELPVEEQTLDRDPSSFDTDYIVLGSQCPSFEPYTVEVGPISKTLSMDLSPLCDFAAKVRPAILGMSYLTAAGIVVAAIRET